MNRKLIFLVDDDEVYLEMLKNYLDKYLQPIELYTNGADCVNNLYKAPAVIVLDFNLNDPNSEFADGGKVFLEIKKKSPQSKVILLSNQESGDIVFELMQFGLKEYVEKNENVFKNLDDIFESLDYK